MWYFVTSEGPSHGEQLSAQCELGELLLPHLSWTGRRALRTFLRRSDNVAAATVGVGLRRAALLDRVCRLLANGSPDLLDYYRAAGDLVDGPPDSPAGLG